MGLSKCRGNISQTHLHTTNSTRHLNKPSQHHALNVLSKYREYEERYAQKLNQSAKCHELTYTPRTQEAISISHLNITHWMCCLNVTNTRTGMFNGPCIVGDIYITHSSTYHELNQSAKHHTCLNITNTRTSMLNRWSTRHKLIYISPTQTAIRLSQTQCVVKVSPIWGLACSTGRVIAQPHIHITNSVSPLCFIVV